MLLISALLVANLLFTGWLAYKVLWEHEDDISTLDIVLTRFIQKIAKEKVANGEWEEGETF